MRSLHKKGDAGIAIALIVVVIVLFLAWLVNIGNRECNSNKDCGSDMYCGSDFTCHSYPNVQKTVVQYSLILPALIIGIAIVVAAYIFKRKEQQANHYPMNVQQPQHHNEEKRH